MIMATYYSTHIEFDRRNLAPDDAERLVDTLAEWHAAVGTSPRGWVDVQLTIPADSLEGAVRLALAVTTPAIQATQSMQAQPLSITAMPEVEFDSRLGVTTMPDLVSVTDAAKALGVSRQRVLQMIDEGKLSSTRVGTTLAIPALEVEARVAVDDDVHFGD
jgi:excisionase family DNA binding protein